MLQVQVSTTRLYLSSMSAVLRETSHDREFLNRLRAFGLPDLGDGYLVSIDTSDGQHVRPHALKNLPHIPDCLSPDLMHHCFACQEESTCYT